MTLQFPIPQFIGEAVRYQGGTWVWDGVGWHVDDTANRIDLATIPAYLGQFTHVLPNALPLPTFISLATPDIYGATFVLSAVAPLEGIKVYKNGELLVMAGGVGVTGQYVVNRAANRIEFLVPLVVQDVITIGVLTPQDRLAPGRVDVQPIKDLDTDWVTNPSVPTTGMVNGVRRTFDLLIDVPGVGQTFAVIARNSDLAVFVGGVRQRPSIDYITVGAEVTMTVAPVAGVPFWALWYMPAGASSGSGVSPPQPPLDGRLSYYGWRPGTGAGWQDARGNALTVATAAARTALRPDIDIVAGSLVLQADTQDLWRWTGAAWVRYLDAGTFTARLGGATQTLRSTTALLRPANGSLLPGQMWVNQADGVFGVGNDAGDPLVLLPRVAASAGVADAGKLAALNAQGVFDQSLFTAGMRPYGTVDPGSIAITDWNDAHLNGTAPVRAPAGTPNRPPGADLPYAGQYIAMGDANTGVLTAFSPQGNTVYVRARNAGAWAAWVQVNSPGLDISSAMLRANDLNDVASKPAGRTNLEVLFNPRTVFAGDLNLLDETGLYPLGIGVTNGWVNDGTGAGGEATVGDAVLHIETGGSLAYQMGFNVIPTGPAAKPLRLRFMTGPTTWTPWVSILTADEVTAQIAAAIAELPPGTSVGAAPPSSPEQGQLWFKTVDPVGLFIWYEDGDSSQWVQTGGGGSGGGSGGGAAATHVGDTPPPNPEQGQLWFRTIEPVGLFVRFIDADSSQWVAVGGSSSSSGGGVAVGAVSFFAASQPPAGWLVCDGAAVGPIYPDLRAYLIAAGSPFGTSGADPLAPDLRGEFIRGADLGRGVDPARVFGSAQVDELKSHQHSIVGQLIDGSIPGGTTDPSVVAGSRLRATIAAATGGPETRPRNVALLPCIRAFAATVVEGIANFNLATTEQARAGLSADTLMTPATTAAAIDALALGVAQTWKTIPPASRPINTAHQNTADRPIMLVVRARTASAGNATIEVSADATNWVALAGFPVSTTSLILPVTFVLPPGHFWRINGVALDVNYGISELS